MTGYEIVYATIDSVFRNNGLDMPSEELYDALTNHIKDDLTHAKNPDYVGEYDVTNEELTFYFNIYNDDYDHYWNRQKCPYAWVAVNLDTYDIYVDQDCN